MKVTVLYFGRIGEHIGITREIVEVPDGSEISVFVSILRNNHAALNLFSDDYFRVARNAKYAAPSEKLSDGDTIALIPPVSGG